MQQWITNTAVLDSPLCLHSLLNEIIQFCGFKHHIYAKDL